MLQVTKLEVKLNINFIIIEFCLCFPN